MIPNQVKLAFDPDSPPQSEEQAEVRKVFADPIAKIIWLCIRPGHLIDQHFANGCLSMATIIRMRGMPKTAADLRLVMCMANRHGMGMGAFATDSLCEEMLPYIRGEKTLEIITPKVPANA